MPQMVLFQTGSMHFVIDQHRIGIIEPKASDLRAGLRIDQRQTIVYEGRSRLLIDLNAALGPDVSRPHAHDAKIIAVKGSPAIALWADRIKGVISVEPDAMDDLPAIFASSASACFSKVLKLSDRLALVVDAAALEKLLRVVSLCAPENQGQAQGETTAAIPLQAAAADSVNEPTGDHALETLVSQKLQQFIGQRVKKALSRTMAETFDQYGLRI